MDSISFNDSQVIYDNLMDIRDRIADQTKQKALRNKVRQIWDKGSAIVEISNLIKEACDQFETKIKEEYKDPAQLAFAQSLTQSIKIYFSSYHHLEGDLTKIFDDQASVFPLNDF